MNIMNKVSRVKNENFTTISNVFLKDKNLSIKAKGFLAVVMGLPSDWEFSINGICSILKEGKTAIYSAIDELKQYGYCTTTIVRDEMGRIIGNDYTFHEEPKTETPYTENLNVDNQPQLNTYNTKDLFDKEEKEDKSSKKTFDFKKALISIGVDENIAKDWIAVRKTKKATNTETAFNRIKNEISKSGLSSNECITIAVENSWQGFKSEWINKNKQQVKQDFFRSYSSQKISDRANDYLHALKVDVDFEMNGIKYLKDGTYINDSKRYYKTKFGQLKEIPVGIVARPNEDWEYDNNSMVWIQDERTETIEDMLF